MAESLSQPHLDITDRLPLLMDRSGSQSRNSDQRGTSEIHDRQEHVIDIARVGTVTSYPISHRNETHTTTSDPEYNDQPSGTSRQLPTSQPSASSTATATTTTAGNARTGRYSRRGENYGRRNRSPLNSGLWISIELIVNLSQIIAAVTVLSVSRHEKPQTPLFEWIIGYTAGCLAAIPHLYWRYTHRNSQSIDRDSTTAQSNTPSNNLEILYAPAPVSEGRSSSVASSQSEQIATMNQRLNSIVDHFKMALDCFFAVWFVVGNVWIFGGRSSATDAPNMYRLCIVFLTFSCIGYAMPFILCATICCCLPCIISILGLREDLGQNRGAAPEVINALPVYKFKLKKVRKRDAADNSADDLGEGGIIAAGTNKERIVSAEDAVCCICLAKYADNDKLRELPCTHFFHMECVDKWLKINALCPLCKLEIDETNRSPPASNPAGNRG